jgi:hypothetical protein
MLRLTSSSRFLVASTVFTPFAFSMLLLTAVLGFAQSTTGIVPYSSYNFHQYDAIDNANLNQMITVPVRTKAGLIPFSANLVMNNTVTIRNSIPSVNSLLVLRITGTGYTGWSQQDVNCPYPLQNTVTTHYYNFSFTDDTGALHRYPVINFDTAGCLTGPGNDEQTSQTEMSGTGYAAEAATNTDRSLNHFTVTDRSGNVFGYVAVSPAALVTDRNGNTLSGARVGLTTTYTDSIAQTVLMSTLGTYGLPHGADTHGYMDANGVNQTVSVNYSVYTQQTAWGCSGGDVAPTSVSWPSSVSWPDGTSLSIGYEHGAGTNAGTVTGRVGSITLPTGGTISYTYSGGSNGINCVDGTPATLARTENGQTATYVHTPTSTTTYHASTVETLPDGGTETFLFTGGLYTLPNADELYSDVVADSTGSIVSTKLINYNGNVNGTAVGTLPISKVDTYVYRGGTSVTAGSVHSQTTFDANFYVMPVDTKVYIPATSGTVYTDTVNTYGSFNGSSCVSGGLTNKVCTSVTSDGSGNILKSSRHTYNSFWNETGASNLVGGTTYLSSSATYNPNGTVATSTSIFGNVTTNTVTSCDNALPTSTSNGVANYTYSWDCNGGMMNSVNNSIGIKSFVYNDPLYRSTKATDESGTAVNYSFSPTSSEGQVTFGPSTVDGIINVDGFGHRLSAQVKNGSSYDTTSHTYLGNHVASDSLSCSAALGGTCGTTKYSYSYDSVGRLSTKTDATTSATRVYLYTASSLWCKSDSRSEKDYAIHRDHL